MRRITNISNGLSSNSNNPADPNAQQQTTTPTAITALERLNKGETLTAREIIELYKQIDSMPAHTGITVYSALVDHGMRNIDFSSDLGQLRMILSDIIDLMNGGYLTYASMLEMTSNNPTRLLSLANGYEGVALVYLVKEKRYSSVEIANLDPELLQEIYSLPRIKDFEPNRQIWFKFREKIQALPFSQEFISRVNNGKYGYLKDKSPWELYNEVPKLNILHTYYNCGERKTSIRDLEFLEFLQTRSAEHILAVVVLVNTDQRITINAWAEANKKDPTLQLPKPKW